MLPADPPLPVNPPPLPVDPPLPVAPLLPPSPADPAELLEPPVADEPLAPPELVPPPDPAALDPAAPPVAVVSSPLHEESSAVQATMERANLCMTRPPLECLVSKRMWTNIRPLDFGSTFDQPYGSVARMLDPERAIGRMGDSLANPKMVTWSSC